MTQLAKIQLEDQSIIFIEVTDNIDTPTVNLPEPMQETQPTSKGGVNRTQIVQNLQTIESTIRAYTTYTLNAFKQIGTANIDKVTLEFGIKVAGEAGIPYVTKGTAESNLKITVECSFPKP